MTSLEQSFAAARAREFNWTDGRVYLNVASYGPLPARSRQAIGEFQRRHGRADLSDDELFAPLTAARASAARLIGADVAEIALTPNTNLAINIAATVALSRAGNRKVIVIHDREFPANVYPWLALERQGFRVQIVPPDEHRLPREDALLERIEAGDVAAVSVAFVQFASGYRADLAAIGAACKRTGTLFVIDAMQGLGAVPLDVRACGADLLACGGQKWLCAPWGSGFAYVRRELITQVEPILPGWLAFEATQDFNRLVEYRYEFLPDARRFETGSLAYHDYLGLQLGIDLLLELGIPNIWQHIRELQDPLIEWARRKGVQVVSDLSQQRRSGVLCIRPERADAAYEALARAGVRCALRESSIRVSPHWYSTTQDIERVIDVLDQHIGNERV